MTIDKARRKQLVARWHRRIAVFISIWLVVLAVSGFAINHAHEFKLDNRSLPAFLQQAVYGIEPVNPDHCGLVSDAEIDCAAIFAHMPTADGALLLDRHSLYMIDPQGGLIEKLGAGQFGLREFEAGLIRESGVYLRDAEKIVRTDSNVLDWEALDAETAAAASGWQWSERGLQGSMVSWERLLLDLHAARFLGPLAKWFNDLMVVLILFIAISGIRLFSLKRNGAG